MFVVCFTPAPIEPFDLVARPASALQSEPHLQSYGEASP
jgi:hypothetical protein